MAFKTNPYLEELEKKHPKLFFSIRLIVYILVLFIGFWLLFNYDGDKSVPIFMLVIGGLGVSCTLLLKILKK